MDSNKKGRGNRGQRENSGEKKNIGQKKNRGESAKRQEGEKRQESEKRQWGRKVGRQLAIHVALYFLAAMAGLFLLLLVYMLPTYPMREHAYRSVPMLVREFETENLIEEYPGTFLGGFTDCLMLENAVYESEEHSVFEQVLCMYRGESGTGAGWAPGYSLIDYLEGTAQPREESYARYWHGYLVVLKPLLFLTTFNSIRIIGAMVQLLLVGMILTACGRRGEHFLGTAFLLSVPFLYYFSLYMSLSLSICFYVLAAVLLAQLKWHETLKEKGWYGLFFFLSGIATVYFDFLTYPLVTLGFPLCVFLYLSRDGFRRDVKHLAGFSAEWGMGYLGFWICKWILADLFTGSGTIRDGFHTLLERTGGVEEFSPVAGFFSVVKQNVSVYRNWGFYLLILGIVIWLACCVWKNRSGIAGENFAKAAVILLVSMYPFVWFLCAQNHSGEHCIYTYKILSVTVFAGICGVGKLWRRGEKAQ